MKILLLSPSVFMSSRFTNLIFAPRDLAITLADSLEEKGHDVTLATAPDVQTKAKVFPGDEALLQLLQKTQEKTDRMVEEYE